MQAKTSPPPASSELSLMQRLLATLLYPFFWLFIKTFYRVRVVGSQLGRPSESVGGQLGRPSGL